MKQLVVMIAGLIFATFAHALEVNPYVSTHFYDNDDAIGVGLDVDVYETQGIVFSTGVEKVSTEVGLKETTTSGNLFTLPISLNNPGVIADLDILDWKVDATYPFVLTDRVLVSPKVGIDVLFFDVNGASDPDNELGVHIGADFDFAIKEGAAINVDLGYQFADVNVAGQEVDLDNFYVSVGFKVNL